MPAAQPGIALYGIRWVSTSPLIKLWPSWRTRGPSACSCKTAAWCISPTCTSVTRCWAIPKRPKSGRRWMRAHFFRHQVRSGIGRYRLPGIGMSRVGGNRRSAAAECSVSACPSCRQSIAMRARPIGTRLGRIRWDLITPVPSKPQASAL